MRSTRTCAALGASVLLFASAASVLLSAPVASAQEAAGSAEEKDIVRASDEVEEQRDLTTEKEDAADASGSEPEPEPDDADSPDEPDSTDTGHMFQFGIRGGFVLGYRMFFRYDDSPFCQEPEYTPGPGARTDKENSICGFGAPPATELALSFAVLDSIEPYIFTRLGLSAEEPTDTEALRLLGVGARIYTMSDEDFKLFVEPAIAYEFEGPRGDPDYCSVENPGHCGDFVANYKKDLVFHLGIGPQYDFARYIGVYLNAGLDVGIFRAIHATLMGNIGLQARFP